MLKVENQEHFDAVIEFAERVGLRQQLEGRLRYLEHYATSPDDPGKTRCRLFKDWARYSFEFVMDLRQPDGTYRQWFNGGLILHGADDGFGSGGAPTFSVCIEPTTGWEIHT